MAGLFMAPTLIWRLQELSFTRLCATMTLRAMPGAQRVSCCAACCGTDFVLPQGLVRGLQRRQLHCQQLASCPCCCCCYSIADREVHKSMNQKGLGIQTASSRSTLAVYHMLLLLLQSPEERCKGYRRISSCVGFVLIVSTALHDLHLAAADLQSSDIMGCAREFRQVQANAFEHACVTDI